MITTLISFAWLATAAPPVSLASPGLTTLNLPPKAVEYFSDQLATQLALQRLHVVTASELTALLGLERQKQLIGCGSDSSCMTELANALGVDGVVTGNVGKFAEAYQINVKVLSAVDGRPLAVWSMRATSDEALLEAFKTEAPRIANDVRAALHRELEPKSSLRPWALIPAAIGVAAVGAAIAMLAVSEGHVTALTNKDSVIPNPQAYADEGKGLRLAGAVTLGVGAACLLGAGALFLLGAESPKPVLAIGRDGASVGIAGTW